MKSTSLCSWCAHWNWICLLTVLKVSLNLNNSLVGNKVEEVILYWWNDQSVCSLGTVWLTLTLWQSFYVCFLICLSHSLQRPPHDKRPKVSIRLTLDKALIHRMEEYTLLYEQNILGNRIFRIQHFGVPWSRIWSNLEWQFLSLEINSNIIWVALSIQ